MFSRTIIIRPKDRWCLTAVFVLCLITGCGLFSIRPVEPPIGVANDPLNFAEILTCNSRISERFYKLAYNDLFYPVNPDSFYETPGGYQSRQACITRYETLIRKYDSITVQWVMKDSTRPESFDQNNRIIINRTYFITAVKDTTRVIQSGDATFELMFYTVKNTWTIVRFIDREWNSVFNPLFND